MERTTYVYSVLLLLTGCGGSELSVDVRPPARTVGSSVLFTVSLNPPAESLYYVQWLVNTTNIITYLNGQNITNPLYTERIAFNSSTGSVELKNLTVTDTGIYGVNVQVTSSSPTIKNTVSFTVYIGPENTAVTASPEKPHYASGSNLSLSCSAQSRPAAQFRWYFNGTALNKTGPVLKLDNVQESESGHYTCLAHNTKTLRYQSSEPSPISVIGKRGRCEEYIKIDGGRPCCGRRLKRSQWATKFICGLGSVCHSSHSEVFSQCITYFAKGNS
ncbi:carcinoembryonic antigen-related cell adhesion molecule 1-like isoform X4 [Arapaima gigas]